MTRANVSFAASALVLALALAASAAVYSLLPYVERVR